MKTKVCSKCKKELPLSEYYKENNETKLKVHSSCKECCKLDGRRRHKENPSKNTERNRLWRKNNPEKYHAWYEKHKEYVSIRRKNKTEELKKSIGKKYYEIQRESARIRRLVVRERFLEVYGESCACCGETTKEFLTIEHINGQKGKKRDLSSSAYSRAVSQYRPDLYEVLCFNCNCGKFRNGGICPHKQNDDYQ